MTEDPREAEKTREGKERAMGPTRKTGDEPSHPATDPGALPPDLSDPQQCPMVRVPCDSRRQGGRERTTKRDTRRKTQRERDR